MLERGGEVDLALEALDPYRGCQLGDEPLEGDVPAVPQVAAEVDHGHAAPTELALDQVSVLKGQRESRIARGHKAPSGRGALQSAAGLELGLREATGALLARQDRRPVAPPSAEEVEKPVPGAPTGHGGSGRPD